MLNVKYLSSYGVLIILLEMNASALFVELALASE